MHHQGGPCSKLSRPAFDGPLCASEVPRVESNYLDTSLPRAICGRDPQPTGPLLDESSSPVHPCGGSSTSLKGAPVTSPCGEGGDPPTP